MLSQKQFYERLKREARYGIIGDAGVSVANPSSDLMKLNKTYKQFIAEASYNQADKKILLEIFETGNMVIDNFDRLEERLATQETLKGLYYERIGSTLG